MHPLPTMSLTDAADNARTGDLWLFRGDSGADRAIRVVTNAPVNHVGMAVVIDDLPPMMWHAELGQGLVDLWTGGHHRGVQLHDLADAVRQWTDRYQQQAWVRQLYPEVGREAEDALMRTIARWDGTPFPSTTRLTWRWLRGRVLSRRSPAEVPAKPSAAFCAEVVGLTYEAMGVLATHRSSSWYDPGRFWSGDDLRLTAGFDLGGEVEVQV